MAKGYWIANVDVRDTDGYKAYVAICRTSSANMAGATRRAAAAPSAWKAKAAAASW